jgi:phospholipid/cholesterol/gamma-HCH transport system permease protein
MADPQIHQEYYDVPKGKFLSGIFIRIFNVTQFIRMFFAEVFMPPYEFKEIIRQAYDVGYRSLGLISLTGFITGVVFTKQARPPLAEFGASSWLPGMISIAIVRALAPLITALIAAGKVGSNMGAELGAMKVTEQIDAMEVSATNPFKFLVVSRIVACIVMIPMLALYMGFIGLVGAWLNVLSNETTSFTAFFIHGFLKISFLDIFSSLIKGMIFGFTIGVAGCFQGYYAERGTYGVGKAANAAVVISMLLVFVEEIIIVQIVNAIRVI